jgi:hypothetical protein
MATEMDTTVDPVVSANDTPQDAEPTESTAMVPTDGPPAKKLKRIKVPKSKKRPARAQVDRATFKMPTPELSGTIYNIWYNKQSGGDSDQQQQFAAPSRCNIARDSGYTRADATPGAFFCLWFARGLCWRGKECEYRHALPGPTDLFHANVDCFGRDRFADYRADMGGVGSFLRPNRTLYVGRIHDTPDVEDLVARHFAEWGPVDRIRVLNGRGIAFVTYAAVASAEFAKEAMAHQALDNNEVLNVRWATVDPNPGAQKREVRRIEEQAAEAIRKALPPAYVAAIEGGGAADGDAEEARKRRRLEGGFGLEGYEASDDVWYEKVKAEWAVEQQARADGAAGEIEAPPEQKAIEERKKPAEQEDDGGIFSGATLAALKRSRAARSSQTAAHQVARKPATPAGPLVGYGTDSEDDD